MYECVQENENTYSLSIIVINKFNFIQQLTIDIFNLYNIFKWYVSFFGCNLISPLI